MPEPVDLTLPKLRHRANLEGSLFLDLYTKLMRKDEIDEDGLVDLLRFAILFLASADDVVARLGYRIVLQYTQVTHDYEPLHAVARARDLVPIVAAAERIDARLADSETLRSALFAAHSMHFVTREQDGRSISRTRGQMELRSFNAREREAVVVAPTSYGKSEMLIEKVSESLASTTCVLVPTRALIAQTRALLIQNQSVRASRIRVITHPDAYVGEERFLAVMTQERLQRLLVEHPDLVLNQLLVDEAHNLLSGDSRALELSRVVLTARARNPELAITYYTPFIAEPDSVRHINDMDARIRSKSINEHVKAERIVHAPPGGTRQLYDQFLDRMIDLHDDVPQDEVDALLSLAAEKTLVYVNRPRDAQALAARVAERRGPIDLSSAELRAVDAIADLIDPNYSLIAAIRSGVMFHHGQVPDVLRQYVERLFRTAAGQGLLVTTSTLLEGVNTPADSLIILSPGRGRRYLTRSAFRNLIGRVGRFQEIFDPTRDNLDLLQPPIYLMPSSYARENWNVETFLSNVANLARTIDDEVENPLLERSVDSPARRDALEYLENIQPGASSLQDARVANSEVGRLCFLNGVRDFDIFAFEQAIQARVDQIRGSILLSVSDLIDAICDVFLVAVELDESNDLVRLRDNDGARAFYTMFVEWRSRNEPFKQIISRFMSYWSQLGDQLIYVGPRWGEEAYESAIGPKLYVRMSTKGRAERVNLAVVKIKEEQDFVDFRLLKYIEILNTLGMLDETLYFQVKYGTADPVLICLLRNGFSPELARLVTEKYATLVVVDLDSVSVFISPELPALMAAEDENDILVYECQTLIVEEDPHLV